MSNKSWIKVFAVSLTLTPAFYWPVSAIADAPKTCPENIGVIVQRNSENLVVEFSGFPSFRLVSDEGCDPNSTCEYSVLSDGLPGGEQVKKTVIVDGICSSIALSSETIENPYYGREGFASISNFQEFKQTVYTITSNLGPITLIIGRYQNLPKTHLWSHWEGSDGLAGRSLTTSVTENQLYLPW